MDKQHPVLGHHHTNNANYTMHVKLYTLYYLHSDIMMRVIFNMPFSRYLGLGVVDEISFLLEFKGFEILFSLIS